MTRHFPIIFVALLLFSGVSFAQEPAPTLTDATAWVPIAETGKPDTRNLPRWVRSVEYSPSGDFFGQTKSYFRIRFPDTAPEEEEIMVRLVFHDHADARPILSVWDEIGNEIGRSDPMGTGSGLPTSETVIVPVGGANYVEIEIPGDGAALRGIFLNRVGQKMIRQPLGFEKPALWEEPFNGTIPIPPSETDTHLFGTVSATILDKEAHLDAKNHSLSLDFDLQKQPLSALVTFEILNPALDSAIVLRCNQTSLGEAACKFPDLADPAYRGVVKPLVEGMRFYYSGWVPAQKVIAGKTLKVGPNALTLTLPQGLDPVAVRSVRIQLKYFWEKIDYEIRP